MVEVLYLFGVETYIFKPKGEIRNYFFFIHGSFMEPKYYSGFIRTLNENGITVISPKYFLHAFSDFKKLSSLTIKIADSIFKIYGYYPACIGGHSAGGYISAMLSENFKCVVLLSPYIPESIKIEKPTLIFGGDRDILTPFWVFQYPVFINAKNNKVLILLKGANHNTYMDKPMFWDIIAGFPPFFQKRYYKTVGNITARFIIFRTSIE